ncbi:MDR family MFS transporter [Microbispora triticiradicis]|uniref:MFS transporter n=1 Tax=Microbispora triticiradicis TaxID=2200763 RepID=A0A5R8YN00_9ACTN|nr:MFS transporter [Microbispora fusca]TLP54852.1 MFS transporter [Microbispora fusca]
MTSDVETPIQPRSGVRGLPGTFWWLWFGLLVNRAGGFIALLLAFYLSARLHYSATLVGLVLGTLGLGGVIGVLVGGRLADSWGRRATIVAANLSAGAALLTLGSARAVWQILVIVLVLGVVQNMQHPAYSAMLIDILPKEDRVRGFSLNYWALNLAITCSAALGGLLAGFDFHLLFVIDGCTSLAMAVIVLLRVPETLHRESPGGSGGAERPRAPGPLRDSAFLSLVVTATLCGLLFAQYTSTLPLVMQRSGFPPSAYGIVAALNGLLIVAGQLLVPRLLRQRDPSRVLALAAAIIGLGFWLNAWAFDLWSYSLSVVVWTFGEMLYSPSAASLSAELSPVTARGRYQAAMGLSWSLGGLLAPLTGGLVLDRLGAGTLWSCCLLIGLCASSLNLLTVRLRRERIAVLAREAA